MHAPSSFVTALLVVLATVMVPAGAWSATAADVIHQRIAVLEDGRPLTIEGVRIGAREFVREFYGARGFKPAWTAPDAVDDLVQGISKAFDHGLDPSDFDAGRLSVLSADRGDDPARIAELDILLTDNAARLLHWLRFGKVRPNTLDPDWNLTPASDPIDIGAMLSGALAANDSAPRSNRWNRSIPTTSRCNQP